MQCVLDSYSITVSIKKLSVGNAAVGSLLLLEEANEGDPSPYVRVFAPRLEGLPNVKIAVNVVTECFFSDFFIDIL